MQAKINVFFSLSRGSRGSSFAVLKWFVFLLRGSRSWFCYWQWGYVFLEKHFLFLVRYNSWHVRRIFFERTAVETFTERFFFSAGNWTKNIELLSEYCFFFLIFLSNFTCCFSQNSFLMFFFLFCFFFVMYFTRKSSNLVLNLLIICSQPPLNIGDKENWKVITSAIRWNQMFWKVYIIKKTKSSF